MAGGGACFPIVGSMSSDSASLPAVIRDRPRVVASACGKTDIGRQRDHNEDQFLVRPEHDLFVVCDGMGGNNAGEVASALAATSLDNFFEATAGGDVPGKIEKEDEELSTAARRLVLGVRKANSDVYEISCTRSEHKGMGSTLVALSISRDAATAQIAHVGDSRCYRIRDGKIEQLTRDHSLIGDALAWNPNLSEAELARLPKNIISRALGLKRVVEVDIRSEPVIPGDIFLLCSDGLSGMVKDQQILELFLLTDDIAEASESLVALANEGGGTDNITAVVVSVDADPKEGGMGPDIQVAPLAVDELLTYLDGTPDHAVAPSIPSARCAVCGDVPSVEKPSVGNAADASHLDSHIIEISYKSALKKDFRFAQSHRPECVWRLQFVSCFWRSVQQAFFR